MKNINDMKQGNTLQTYQQPSNLPMVQQQQETASSAVAAQAKAMVEARYVMAMQRPRIWEQVRQTLLEECKRPSFANNKSAFYIKPIGNGVQGLGIRFVEVALRCMTNVLIETTMIFEDESKEIHRVSVTDLESNITYPLDIRVSKTVERSKAMDDGSYISVRKNSYQKDVFTVPANDDDLLNKRGAQISKAIRTLGLRIIPGDLRDEAEETIIRVRRDQAAKDPGAERKKIADAFAGIGVKAADLIKYLGHGLDTCSPTELVELRGIWGAISDGEATWKTVMENKRDIEGADTPPPAKDVDSLKKPRTKPTVVEPADKTIVNDDDNSAVIDRSEPTSGGYVPTPEEEAEIRERENAQAEADERAKRGEDVQAEQQTGGRRGRGGNKEFNLGE